MYCPLQLEASCPLQPEGEIMVDERLSYTK